jgi:ribonuclease Z
VEAGEQKLLLDVGPGVPANLAALEVPLELIDKVLITHQHMDHIGGLDQLWIGGWTYGRRVPLRIWGPPGMNRIAEHLRGVYEWDIETRIAVLPSGGEELVSYEYSEGVIYEAEGVTVAAFPVVHTPPHNSYGFRVEFRDHTFVFSGDTKRCQSLIDNAQDVDLLVHESFPPAELYAERAGRPIELAKKIAEELHTSPREVGTVFRDTNPRLGVIYHMYNNDDLIIPAADQVRETYGGRFIVGQDLTVINIGEEVTVRRAIFGDKAWPVRVL